MNKNLSYILIGSGFLGAAFYASLDPIEMNWTPFVIALLISFTGLFMLKKIEHDHKKNPDILESNRAHIHESLDNILKNITELNSDKENIPTFEMRYSIDDKFRDDIDRFVLARESIKHIYSLQDYANIMTAFATGERYLNRVWSASADGYIDEVLTYTEKAMYQFQDAKKLLDNVSAKHA